MPKPQYNVVATKMEVLPRKWCSAGKRSKKLTAGYKTKLTCPIQRTVALISDKWKVLIICTLTNGKKRFGELQREMEGITPTVLTRALRDLEADGLIHRTVFAEVPPRVEYTLTPLGESLLPILRDLHEWADRNAAQLLARFERPVEKPAPGPTEKPAA